MQKLHVLPLVEFAQPFVGEDFMRLPDSFSSDADEAAVKGMLSCGTRRAMVKYLWIDVKLRDIICQFMLPDTYPEKIQRSNVHTTIVWLQQVTTALSSTLVYL